MENSTQFQSWSPLWWMNFTLCYLNRGILKWDIFWESNLRNMGWCVRRILRIWIKAFLPFFCGVMHEESNVHQKTNDKRSHVMKTSHYLKDNKLKTKWKKLLRNSKTSMEQNTHFHSQGEVLGMSSTDWKAWQQWWDTWIPTNQPKKPKQVSIAEAINGAVKTITEAVKYPSTSAPVVIKNKNSNSNVVLVYRQARLLICEWRNSRSYVSFGHY